MRTALSRLIALFIAFASFACHDDPHGKGSAQDVCRQGGASLSAANECACPDAQRWNGAHCEAALAGAAGLSAEPAVKAVAKPNLPPVHGAAEEHVPDDAAPNEPKEQGPHAFDLRAVCAAAKAHYDAKDAYCHCPGGDVLIGASCRALAGQVNQAACEGVQRPGHWLKAHCDCEPGKDFIPGRGGCVARKALSQTTGRRLCEASLNRGKWDAGRARCDCGMGRVWSGALCELQTSLPSREVCEGGSNHGRWDKDHKRCDCPAGRLWIDQSCRLAANVDALAACVSEANGGRWNAAEGRCDCPVVGRTGRWDAKDKTCR